MNIIHVDMDAFYASVEVLKDPSLKGRPVVVGGSGGRGVVTSASYEARAYGVTSAMPIVRARRLCPHAAFVPNDFSAYQSYSSEIRKIFESVTPLVEPLSLDEAFLDVSGARRIFGEPASIAAAVKHRVGELGLVCTVGVAPNKFLAKLASTTAKPDGLLVVSGDVTGWLHPLPVSALWGVGEQTAETLRRLGLRTVGDVAAIPRRTLERAVGDALGAHLHELAQGHDTRPVVPGQEAKSVGSEETFDHDLDSVEEIRTEILRLSDRTAGRLRAKGLCGRTITLKVRYANFRTITRSRTAGEEIDTAAEIFEIAGALFDRVAAAERIGRSAARVRLVGVSVGNLVPGPPRRQLDLLADSARARWSDAARAVDDIRSRFGDAAVHPAALLPRAGENL